MNAKNSNPPAVQSLAGAESDQPRPIRKIPRSALHDGAHRLLARDVRLNDRFARLLGLAAGVPLAEDFYGYRKRHFAHHRCTNTEEDPDGWIPEEFYEIPRWQGAMFLLQALGGIIFARILIGFFARQWKRSRLGFCVSLAAATAIAAGIVLGFPPAVLFGLYWIVPLATWGLFVNLLRALAEHYPEPQFQRDVNFHLSHHLVPSVPFYALPKLQRELAKSEPYQAYAHVTRGYHEFLLEYFFKRSQPAGTPDLEHQKSQAAISPAASNSTGVRSADAMYAQR